MGYSRESKGGGKLKEGGDKFKVQHAKILAKKPV